MRIFGYGASEIARLYGAGAKNKNAGKGSANPVKGDTLQISPEAKALSTFKAILEDIPPVRDELVEDLKTQINKGEYKPDTERIVSGIIREWLIDEEV